MFLEQREDLCRDKFRGVHHSTTNGHGKQSENGETKRVKLGKDSEDAVARSESCGPHGLTHIGTQVAVSQFYSLGLSGSAGGVQKGGHFIWSWPSGQDAVPKPTRHIFQVDRPNPGGGGPNISTIGRTVTQASAPLSAKMWVRSSSETKKLRGTTRRPVLQMPNMARGASPDVGSMKAVAEEQPSESRCLARDALPARSSIFFQDRWSSVNVDRSGRWAQSLEELGSNQQLEGSVSGQGGIRTRGRG